MKITIVNGQNHKGSTRMIARELAEKVGGEIAEFFLPRDFDEPCLGCYSCFKADMTLCPHYEKLRAITEAMDASDLIILDSPVYVFHASGQMMSLLDHYGTRWMVHRPEESMFRKQGVCISTAAGGGMRSTNKDMADSLEFWGLAKVYRLGFGVQATRPEEIPPRIQKKIHRATDRLAKRIRKNAGKLGVTLRGRFWFAMTRLMHRLAKQPAEPDYSYWEARGWHSSARPWKKAGA